jgi:hypothetical protein
MTQWLSDAWDLFWISDAPFLIAIALFTLSIALIDSRSQS